MAPPLHIPDDSAVLRSQLRRVYVAAGQGISHSCPRECLSGFRRVPRVVRLDNLKAGVARACLYDPDIGELYAAFAKHWGFVPLPCRPRHPQEQGVVERGGSYLKNNALKGRKFDSLEDLDAFLKRWNRTVARARIHGRTCKRVYTHFLEVEKPALKPLPAERFSLFEVGTRTVHLDGYVEVDRAFYAVSERLLGEEVRTYWDDRLVRIYHEGQCVSVCTRAPAGTFNSLDEHRPALSWTASCTMLRCQAAGKELPNA